MRETTPVGGHDYYGPDINLRDRTVDAVRRRLGEEAFHRAVELGRGMDPTAAVETARQPATDGV